MIRCIDADPLKAKIKRQAAEITRLLTENKELKERVEKANRTSLHGGRIAGQNEAWELARKIFCQPINVGYKFSELKEIFDEGYISGIFEKYTYTEAATKVEEWENAKEEIKRGDIIRNKYNTSSKFCVTDIGCDGHLYGVGGYGLIYSNQDPEYWEKTGHHIDIDGFLKQIGGAE